MIAVDRPSWWHSVKWPLLVAALLAGHVFLVTGALLLSSTWIPGASSHPRRLVEELRWDDLQALRQASAHLGWELEVVPTGKTELNGNRQFQFTLLDDRGAPIRDAQIQVAIYHHSRPNRLIELAFGPGLATDGHRASLDVNREGSWHVSALASRGPQQYLAEADFWVGDDTEGLR